MVQSSRMRSTISSQRDVQPQYRAVEGTWQPRRTSVPRSLTSSVTVPVSQRHALPKNRAYLPNLLRKKSQSLAPGHDAPPLILPECVPLSASPCMLFRHTHGPGRHTITEVWESNTCRARNQDVTVEKRSVRAPRHSLSTRMPSPSSRPPPAPHADGGTCEPWPSDVDSGSRNCSSPTPNGRRTRKRRGGGAVEFMAFALLSALRQRDEMHPLLHDTSITEMSLCHTRVWGGGAKYGMVCSLKLAARDQRCPQAGWGASPPLGRIAYVARGRGGCYGPFRPSC